MSVFRSVLIFLFFGLALGSVGVTPLQAQSRIELLQEAEAAEEAGRYKEAGRLFEQLYEVFEGDPAPLHAAAKSYAQAGLHDQAFKNLERVVEAGWASVEEMKQDPALASLHEDERWNELVAEAEARYAALDLELRQELLAMEEQDQRVRANFNEVITQPGTEADSALARMEAQDELLGTRIKEIIREHGWPGRRLVGDDAAHAVWLLVMHTDSAFFQETLPLLLDAAERGEARKADAAYLHDRALVYQEKPQIYGTQTHWEQGIEQPRLEPIQDEGNVDERRAAIKMPPLSEYLAEQGIEYVPSGEREN